MIDVLQREFIYIYYYFDLQLRQIFWYWVFGMAIGSFVSVFAKEHIHAAFSRMGNRSWGVIGIVPATLLGVASPLCMYGTIPVAASFRQQGMREDWLAAFMMASVLLNPQLIIYSSALGLTVLSIRIAICILCGISAGLLVHFFCKGREFFDFSDFDERRSRDTDPVLLVRYLRNFGRNIRATGIYFIVGILLSALFQRYVPSELIARLFGADHAWGVLLSATIGVPLYACGGGTIPLLREWISSGMSLGSASAFMITGPATKITNLGALKIAFGLKGFVMYLLFVLVYSLACGLAIDMVFAPL
ncbi:MAG: permease [Spirochaetales bacterium]|nr:permease [Spirochaetales bacterium]